MSVCGPFPAADRSVENEATRQIVSVGREQQGMASRLADAHDRDAAGVYELEPLEVVDSSAEMRYMVLPPRPAGSDGMTEELISSVSKMKGLRVIARTSVMKYKGTQKSIADIGRELNVGSVLEGSVRKAGDKIRITVQLVDTLNEEPQWTREYDREISDVFSVQSDIARRVAEALRNRILGGGAPERDESRMTSSSEAYTNYLRGRQFWSKRTEESLKKSIDFFESALKHDEDYAQAYTGLADSYATLAFLEFMAPHEAYPKARKAVERALALDAKLAEAHTSLGLIRFQYDWDWQGAEEAFREAIRLNPNYAPAHHFFADYLKAMGRFEEALAEIEKAQELDPLSLVISTGVGHVLYLSRQYDRAIEQYREAVDLDPGFVLTHVWFGRPYLEKGMFREAIAELQMAVKLSKESTLALAMLGHGFAAAGRTAGYRRHRKPAGGPGRRRHYAGRDAESRQPQEGRRNRGRGAGERSARREHHCALVDPLRAGRREPGP